MPFMCEEILYRLTFLNILIKLVLHAHRQLDVLRKIVRFIVPSSPYKFKNCKAPATYGHKDTA
jgi:hypothetical protein